jgi:hypothetical protein
VKKQLATCKTSTKVEKKINKKKKQSYQQTSIKIRK